VTPAPVDVGVPVVPGRQAAPPPVSCVACPPQCAAPGSRSAAGHTSGRPHPAPGSPGTRGDCPARRPRRGPSSTTRPVTCPGRGRQARTISDSCDSTLPCVPADPATPPRSDTGTRSPRRPDGDHATDATDPTPSASTGRSQPLLVRQRSATTHERNPCPTRPARARRHALAPGGTIPPRGCSSVGQSKRLIIARSQVRGLPAPPEAAGHRPGGTCFACSAVIPWSFFWHRKGMTSRGSNRDPQAPRRPPGPGLRRP
jgi:hypothetical protein